MYAMASAALKDELVKPGVTIGTYNHKQLVELMIAQVFNVGFGVIGSRQAAPSATSVDKAPLLIQGVRPHFGEGVRSVQHRVEGNYCPAFGFSDISGIVNGFLGTEKWKYSMESSDYILISKCRFEDVYSSASENCDLTMLKIDPWLRR